MGTPWGRRSEGLRGILGAKGWLGGWEMAESEQVRQLLETAWPCLPHPPPHRSSGPAGTFRALLGVPGDLAQGVAGDK